MNKTLFLLMYQFESTEIPLEKICDEFGLKIDQAKRKAAQQLLPIPFYKKNAKGGYFCNTETYAKYLDDLAKNAQIEHQKMNSSNTQRARA